MNNQQPFLSNKPTRAARDGFGQGLVELAQADPNVVGLCADLTESVRMQPFAEAFPHRFIEVGVAEQNLIGVAAGLAMAGKVPFAASYAVFSPGRSWDQIRVSVCYSNLNVKIVSGHAGLSVGPDGATHQALEDIAMMRVLPNVTVVVPADAEEARKATHAIGRLTGPCYLRLGREKVRDCTSAESVFELGTANILRSGYDLTIIACGLMVQAALQAAEILEHQGISARVINVHTIKPIDQKTIIQAAVETGAIVTAEEHQIYGGLGGAVAEVIVSHCPVPMKILGVNDTFGESGPADQLLTKYGLTANSVVAASREVLKAKKR
jgi:transketolase